MSNTPPPSASEDHLRLVVRDEVGELIRTHVLACPFTIDHHPKRLRHLETNYARLTGFLLASGLLGGTAGAAVAAIFK